jgi:replicative DNA helicase
MLILAARPGVGKALALDTLVPTPSGLTTMGELRDGDLVFDEQGHPCRVLKAHPIRYDRPCYAVYFSDGTTVIADAEHLWWTWDRRARRYQANPGDYRVPVVPQVRTTDEIAATLRVAGDQRANHAIRIAAHLKLPEAQLPLPPYTLGAWLGDGTTSSASLTAYDPEILIYIELEGIGITPRADTHQFGLKLPGACSHAGERKCLGCSATFREWRANQRSCSPKCAAWVWRHHGTVEKSACRCCGQRSEHGHCQPCRDDHGTFQGRLRKLGVLGKKHIPVQYLRTSEAQRRLLLAGLLDTDGTVGGSGSVQFTSTNQRLAEDVRELISSLGYQCAMSRKPVNGRTVATSVAYTLSFTTEDEVFRLERKQLRHKERRGKATPRQGFRYITDVRPIPAVPVRCITVDSPSGLYLVTRAMVPTHNTALALQMSVAAARMPGSQPILVFSLEMSKEQLTLRMLCAEGRVNARYLRESDSLSRQMGAIMNAGDRLGALPILIDDTASASVLDIRTRAKRLQLDRGLGMIIIDYVQLLSSGRRRDSRQQEVSEISRELKMLAKELNVPVLALSQLNRAVEGRGGDKPQLSDLCDSGSLEQDADVVMFICRSGHDSPDVSSAQAELIVAKQRNGPLDMINLVFHKAYARFDAAAREYHGSGTATGAA